MSGNNKYKALCPPAQPCYCWLRLSCFRPAAADHAEVNGQRDGTEIEEFLKVSSECPMTGLSDGSINIYKKKS